MPIKKRDTTASGVAASAVPLPYVPDPAARLQSCATPSETRLAAFKTYALPGTPPKDIPSDDIVRLLRAPQNDENVDLVYRNRIKGRLTAIRAFCVFCQGGSPKAARLCANVTCPLWAFRTGANGMRGERK